MFVGVAPVTESFEVFESIVEKVSVFVMYLGPSCFPASFTWSFWVVSSSPCGSGVSRGEWLCRVSWCEEALSGIGGPGAGIGAEGHGVEDIAPASAALGIVRVGVRRAEVTLAGWTQFHRNP